MNSHTAFLGDGEKTFALTPVLIEELQRKAGAGIGTICKRVFAGHFDHADLIETIRLALIGGGTDPKEAADLMATYVLPRPIAENFTLAVAILEIVYFGTATKLPKGKSK